MGMTKGCTSTIDAAEEIVNEIAKREGVDPSTMTFCDLQTQQGYSNIKSGRFIIDELVCVTINVIVVLVTEWRDSNCAPEVLRHFQGYIND
jgi:hypothetical protein